MSECLFISLVSFSLSQSCLGQTVGPVVSLTFTPALNGESFVGLREVGREEYNDTDDLCPREKDVLCEGDRRLNE